MRNPTGAGSKKWSWAGKVVIVTGASQGIGASCAKRLGEHGARLSLTALAAKDFRDGESADAVATAGDLTDPATRARVIERTLQTFGRIDVLINNAGVGQYGYPSQVDTETSKRLFDTNVFCALALAQLAIPQMRAQASGVIVNVGSVGGKVSLPWAVMYCASKWALHCVSDGLRRELAGTGVHVMKVCAGIVSTGFREHVLAGSAPGPVEDIRRTVTPEQVAATIMYGVERRKSTIYVPKIGLAFTSLDFFAPWLMDWYLRGKF